MKKRLNDILFRLGVTSGPFLIRAMAASWSIRWIGEEHLESCRAAGEPVIYTFWHSRLLPLTFTHRKQGIRILISNHRDGEIIRRVTGKLGFGAVRGSTGKGGARAILLMARAASEGHDTAITPDGPKGPREVVQAGVVRIAQRAGVPVLPLTSAASKARRLRSWDRFLVPRLFSRVVVGYGPPIRIPPDLTVEEAERYRIEIEKAVSDLTDEADRLAATG